MIISNILESVLTIHNRQVQSLYYYREFFNKYVLLFLCILLIIYPIIKNKKKFYKSYNHIVIIIILMLCNSFSFTNVLDNSLIIMLYILYLIFKKIIYFKDMEGN